MISLSKKLLLLFSLALGSHSQGIPTDYAPEINLLCPDTPLIREWTPQTQALHPDESTYIAARESTAIAPAWSDWLGDGSFIGYDSKIFEGKFPRVGLAISGGGHRAAQYAAGVVSALDARNESAKATGTGGLFQVTSYITGLSGKPLDIDS
jgi:lysophospholipase